jgi:hypothetical protein
MQKQMSASSSGGTQTIISRQSWGAQKLQNGTTLIKNAKRFSLDKKWPETAWFRANDVCHGA